MRFIALNSTFANNLGFDLTAKHSVIELVWSTKIGEFCFDNILDADEIVELVYCYMEF